MFGHGYIYTYIRSGLSLLVVTDVIAYNIDVVFSRLYASVSAGRDI